MSFRSILPGKAALRPPYRGPVNASWALLAIGNEITHYPTYNGIVMAFSLKPNGEGNGWDGSAVYYPRDSVFGYADFRVAAHRL